jgi:hypothetical protein
VVLAIKLEKTFFYLGGGTFDPLLMPIESVHISIEEPSWVFRLDSQGMLSVKENYSFLLDKLSPSSFLSSKKATVLSKVWVSWAPSKVAVFSNWQALFDKDSNKV